MELEWKRGLTAGTALSAIMAGMSWTTADDGSEVVAVTKTLVACLLVMGSLALAAWLAQRRRSAR